MKQEDTLFSKLILKLRSNAEVDDFFSDILSSSEYENLKHRIEILELIKKGVSYQDISRQTGSSSATIAKVKESFEYGSGMLKKVLDRI